MLKENRLFNLKRSLLAVLAIILTFALTGCGPELRSRVVVNANFSGVRETKVTIDMQELFKEKKVDQAKITEIIKKYKPAQIVYGGQKTLENGKLEFDFKLNFKNVEDYARNLEQIVHAGPDGPYRVLVWRKATPINDGYIVREEVSDEEYFGWLADALVKEGLVSSEKRNQVLNNVSRPKFVKQGKENLDNQIGDSNYFEKREGYVPALNTEIRINIEPQSDKYLQVQVNIVSSNSGAKISQDLEIITKYLASLKLPENTTITDIENGKCVTFQVEEVSKLAETLNNIFATNANRLYVSILASDGSALPNLSNDVATADSSQTSQSDKSSNLDNSSTSSSSSSSLPPSAPPAVPAPSAASSGASSSANKSTSKSSDSVSSSKGSSANQQESGTEAVDNSKDNSNANFKMRLAGSLEGVGTTSVSILQNDESGKLVPRNISGSNHVYEYDREVELYPLTVNTSLDISLTGEFKYVSEAKFPRGSKYVKQLLDPIASKLAAVDKRVKITNREGDKDLTYTFEIKAKEITEFNTIISKLYPLYAAGKLAEKPRDPQTLLLDKQAGLFTTNYSIKPSIYLASPIMPAITHDDERVKTVNFKLNTPFMASVKTVSKDDRVQIKGNNVEIKLLSEANDELMKAADIKISAFTLTALIVFPILLVLLALALVVFVIILRRKLKRAKQTKLSDGAVEFLGTYPQPVPNYYSVDNAVGSGSTSVSASVPSTPPNAVNTTSPLTTHSFPQGYPQSPIPQGYPQPQPVVARVVPPLPPQPSTSPALSLQNPPAVPPTSPPMPTPPALPAELLARGDSEEIN